MSGIDGARFPNRDPAAAGPSSSPVSGIIRPVGPVPDGLASWLVDELNSFWPASRWSLGSPLQPSPDWGSGPVDVDLILDAVIDSVMEGDDAPTADGAPSWTLALTGIHAVAPGRGEVFGRATVGGGSALVAIRPLRRGTARSGEGLALLRTRVLKESLHELGHAAGRVHCPSPRCLMHPVHDLSGVDARPFRFCARCDPFPRLDGTR